MLRDDLIKELMKYPADAEVKFEYSYKDQCYCKPDDDSCCYCGYTDARDTVRSVDLLKINEYGNKCKPEIVLKGS